MMMSLFLLKMAHGFFGKFHKAGRFLKKMIPHAKRIFNSIAPKLMDIAEDELNQRGYGGVGKALRTGYDALSGLRYT
jgi:hypothetical protein